MVGEARSLGLMGTLALTPHKESRATFAGKQGAIGLRTRTRCFANGLVMRHVGDRMIIAPPLVISHAEIDSLVELAYKSIDEAYIAAKADGLMVPA